MTEQATGLCFGRAVQAVGLAYSNGLVAQGVRGGAAHLIRHRLDAVGVERNGKGHTLGRRGEA